MRARWALAMTVLAVCGSAITKDADAQSVSLLLIHNDDTHARRVQIAVGQIAPCDSPQDQLVFDETIAPQSTRGVALPAAMICGRNTSADSAINWDTSRVFPVGFCRFEFGHRVCSAQTTDFTIAP